MAHPYPPFAGEERETLVAFLDFYRAVMLDKAAGLTAEQLATRLGPSTLTLGGLIHHLAVVEHWWFNEALAGNEQLEPWASAPWGEDRDWEFTVAPELEPELITARYLEAIELSRQIEAATPSLDTLSAKSREGRHWSLRWILIHMIEETARHAGHADLIRESIDGSVGDFREE